MDQCQVDLCSSCTLPFQPPSSSSAASSSLSVVQKLTGSKSSVTQLYRYPGLSESALKTLLKKVCCWTPCSHLPTSKGLSA